MKIGNMEVLNDFLLGLMDNEIFIFVSSVIFLLSSFLVLEFFNKGKDDDVIYHNKQLFTIIVLTYFSLIFHIMAAFYFLMAITFLIILLKQFFTKN